MSFVNEFKDAVEREREYERMRKQLNKYIVYFFVLALIILGIFLTYNPVFELEGSEPWFELKLPTDSTVIIWLGERPHLYEKGEFISEINVDGSGSYKYTPKSKLVYLIVSRDKKTVSYNPTPYLRLKETVLKDVAKFPELEGRYVTVYMWKENSYLRFS